MLAGFARADTLDRRARSHNATSAEIGPTRGSAFEHSSFEWAHVKPTALLRLSRSRQKTVSASVLALKKGGDVARDVGGGRGAFALVVEVVRRVHAPSSSVGNGSRERHSAPGRTFRCPVAQSERLDAGR